jgi:cytochrome c5
MRLVMISFVLAACTNSAPPPAATRTVCPDPDPNTLTWDNFGQKFMSDYCTWCHASTLPHAQRNGAPLYHDFDTLRGVTQVADHIDKVAGSGPAAHNTAMPPSQCPSVPGGPLDRDCPTPSDAERTNLSMWLACEVIPPP